MLKALLNKTENYNNYNFEKRESLYQDALYNLKIYRNYTVTKISNKTNDRNENGTLNSNPSIWILEKLQCNCINSQNDK